MGDWRDTPTTDLELSVRSTNTLVKMGLTTQGQVYDFFTLHNKTQVLREISGFGTKSYYEVMGIVNEIRRALRGDTPEQRPELPTPWYMELEKQAYTIDHESTSQLLLHSIAISTKRIADALSSDKIKELYTELLFQPTNQYGEGLMEGIQGSIRRGQQGIE